VTAPALEIQYTRPWLYPEQRDAIFSPARYAAIEASTKSGKTHGCLVWLFEKALQGKPGYSYWWVAPSRRQAKMGYRRLKLALRRSGHLFSYNDTEHTITLPVGSIISFLTGEKPDLLYGDDVYAAVIDEATRVREDAWHAIRSTLTKTQGPLRIIGNVRGRKNWAYQIARKAQAGDPDMHYAKLTYEHAVAAGIVKIEEVEDARRMLPEQIFKELYLAEPSDDGGNPFGLQHIAACVERFRPGGTVKLWAWDLARSFDFTVGIGLDDDAHVCQIERFQESWPRTRERIITIVGKVRAVIEVNSAGNPVFEEITRHGQHQNFQAFLTTGPSKQQIMENLAAGIQQHVLGIPDGVLRRELDTFEYVVKRSPDGRVQTFYSAPEGLHDDCVMALAIAWQYYVRKIPLSAPVSMEQASKWR